MKLKAGFEIDTLPGAYYAHIMQLMEPDCSDLKYGIIFEAVKKEQIRMFVSKEVPEALLGTAAQSVHFNALWQHFKEGGMESKQFLSQKALYLAEASNVEITLLIEDFGMAMEIWESERDWWEILVYPSQGEVTPGCILSVPGEEELEEEFPFMIEPVSEEEEDALYKLYEPYIDNQNTGRFWSEKDANTAYGVIGGNTVFSFVNVVYVGAGLCCSLEDTAGTIVGFFDMGYENSFSHRRLSRGNPASAATMHAQKWASLNAVATDVIQTPNQTVILSHWHLDHVRILCDMADDYMRNGNGSIYAPFWQQAYILAPSCIAARGWGMTYFAQIQGAMQQAGNNRNFVTVPYQNVSQTIALNTGWANMNVYKCDRNDTFLRNPNHHDHGIFAVITLGNGNEVFLSGDCAYDTLSVNNPNDPILHNPPLGYEYLVVSHHGGKYAHTTQNPAQYIPQTNGTISEAFFSANGVAYGHPVLANLIDYANAGWNNIRMDQAAAVGIWVYHLR